MINCEKLKPFISNEYRNLPESRYISIFLIRTTQSEAIFRTEGSGEGCSREIIADNDGKSVCRSIISKRKQIAVERREGRQLLRKYNLLFANKGEIKDDTVCSMNRNNPCEKCIDCMLYGYAVGAGGAQRSRVISDDAFSLLPFDIISDKKTFNALYETGTMRDPVTKKPSSSINEDEYIIPGAHFLDIEVLKDVTEEEFIYVIGNILRSKRYGAITSRIGSVTNTIVSIIGSDTELFSTLEWINETESDLKMSNIEHPQPLDKVIISAKKSIYSLIPKIYGHCYVPDDNKKELEDILNTVKQIYSDPKKVEEILKKLTNSYPRNEGPKK
ncbi:MAG: type I-D CRISPR-associated protein Cas7/Csc2 [Desulfobacterales bacterium]|nr:type I-D CRISPR-associated protein Cas7/Csc2 [Desulfobacterales bacterium]